MKKIKLLFIIFGFCISAFGQSEKYELNNCTTKFSFNFYDSSLAKAAKDAHMSSSDNSINIIVEDNGGIYFKNNVFSTGEELVNAIKLDLNNRVNVSSQKDIEIGLNEIAHFERLSELMCWLEGLGANVISGEVFLYLF
ncbi:hypothetical protein [uncultured Dokdonia sp.]|uniref:hypothetical protein n=1 Tax=uncultured Dokdonia sp. TaxID=575653 RepID=UPI00262FBAE4|nr:hypothetical protein [uncultured Dokdonia sp.]